MSRSGLFRAAALLAASASPLLVGSANAAETPGLTGVAPEVPAEKVAPVLEDATSSANPLHAGDAVKLPSVKTAAPALPQVPQAPAAEAPAAERSLPIGTLPKLPDTNTVPDTKVGGIKAPAVSELPGVDQLQGTLPSLG